MRIVLAMALLAAACGSDNKQTPADAAKVFDAPKPADAALTDGGVDASCFTNPDPNSNYQIINACTTAQKVYTTHPAPLLLNADGSLPPLP
jgi:hypothetical protein